MTQKVAGVLVPNLSIQVELQRRNILLPILIPHAMDGSTIGAASPAAMAAGVAVVGDFNSTRWSSTFSDFFDSGFHDAHEDVARGLSTSWPDHRLPFPMMRLDHALMNADVAALDVTDVEVPGSDHIGFVATMAARTTPP